MLSVISKSKAIMHGFWLKILRNFKFYLKSKAIVHALCLKISRDEKLVLSANSKVRL